MEPIVGYLPANNDGCAYWRMFLPHLRVPFSRYITTQPVPYKVLEGCNVVVIQRLATQDNYNSLLKMKEVGYKIVYDLDDDMWAVQSSNPAKQILDRVHREELGFRMCAELCDLVTVSTTRLETSVKDNNLRGIKCPVKVIGNAVDMALFQPSILPKRDDRVVVGWSGSTTHIEDLSMMGSSMLELINLEQKAYLHFVGMVPSVAYAGHKRIMAHGWVPVKEYPIRLSTWNWDIALAPLNDNRFNRSKSCIKMQEAGALKIPCLVSNVQPYEEFCSHDSELEWLICRNPKDWLTKVRTLVNEKERREFLGERMFQVTMNVYNMEDRGKVWYQAFKGLLQ